MASPIIVIGAGLSGLLLAQGLRKYNIPFRIFERDENLAARTQGYRVRLSDGGIQALRDCLQVEHFKQFQRSCAQGISSNNAPSMILDAVTGDQGPPLFKGGAMPPVGSEDEVLSVDRGTARRVLVQGLDEQLEFGKDFESFEEDACGVTVNFRDGSKVHGAALIAADGAMSRVRSQLLPSYRLADSEGRLIFGKTDITDDLMKQLLPNAQSGLKFMRSETRKCLFEVMHFDPHLSETPADYIYWVLFAHKDELLPDPQLLSLGTEETVQLVQRLTKGWHEQLRCLFNAPSARGACYRIVTSRPAALPSLSKASSRTVLIGDARHPMSPTAALGATTALTDATVVLSEILGASTYASKFEAAEAAIEQNAVRALGKSLIGGCMMFRMQPFDSLPIIEV